MPYWNQINFDGREMVVKYIFFFDFLYQVQSGTITKYQPDFRPGSLITLPITSRDFQKSLFLWLYQGS